MQTHPSEPFTELVRKWTQIFSLYDLDNDGILRKKDFDIVQDTIISKANLSEDERSEVLKLSHDMWVHYLNQELDGELKLDDFVAQFMQAKIDGHIEALTREYRSRMFYCMDLNRDNLINNSEFLMFAESLGKSDTPHLDRAFKTIDTDADGKVTLEEYTDAYVRYMADPSVTMENLPLFGLPK